MGVLGLILVLIGAITAFVYSIILLVKAFQASIIWGLIYLFVPGGIGAIIFIFTHWDEAGKPFLMQMLAIGMMFAGMLMMPGASS